MKFANLTPADRMKASGMIGLIVVLVFFIVHTVMGAVAPKKPGAPAPDAAGQPGAAPAPPAPPASAGGTTDPMMTTADKAFPMGRLASTQQNLRDEGVTDMNVHDPFMPKAKAPEKKAGLPAAPTAPPPARKTARTSDPDVSVSAIPMSRHMENFTGGSGGGLPPIPVASGGTVPAPPGIAPVAPPAEPEVRVIGVVHGEKSLATLSVGGRVVIARPGDALAKGYRLQAVNAEGVSIRHDNQNTTLHVGDSMNGDKSVVERKP